MSLAEQLQELAASPHDVAGAQEAIAASAKALKLAEQLEEAVADYLDTERAWQFDECPEEHMQAAYGRMKRKMYEFREAKRSAA